MRQLQREMVTALTPAGFSDPRINPLSCQDKSFPGWKILRFLKGSPWQGQVTGEEQRKSLCGQDFQMPLHICSVSLDPWVKNYISQPPLPLGSWPVECDSCEVQFPGSVLRGKKHFHVLSDIPWVPPVLLTMLCGCSGGLLCRGAEGGIGAGGAGAGGPALASDPSVMGDSSGSGPPGPP